MTIAAFDLNLRHLRAIPAIVARGSISAAAEAVNLSQPALTQGLAKLEARIGAPLFARYADGMTATALGRIFADRVTAALAYLAAATPRRTGGRGFARPELLMTATQLAAFLALVEAGSFVGAAAATGLSQPAIHRAVRDLEQLGALPLVERRGRGVMLTEAGRRLARAARLARGEIEAALAEVAPGGEGGRVVVGAMPFCRAILLPTTLARFVAGHAASTVDVVEGSWRELVEPLRDGVIDLMIGALRDDDLPDLVQTPLCEDRLAVVARAGHPLTHGVADVAALARYAWILGGAGTPLRSHWEAMFAGVPLPRVPIECGSVMTIRGVLRDSDLLTLISPDQVALEIAGGQLARIRHTLPATARRIGVTTRAGWRPTGGQARFLALLRAAALQLSE